MTGSKSRVLRGLFVREQGLRAGWSVLIFLAIVVVLSALGGTLVGHFFPDEDMHVVSPDTLCTESKSEVPPEVPPQFSGNP